MPNMTIYVKAVEAEARVWREAKLYAKRRGFSVSELIVRALRDYLAAHEVGTVQAADTFPTHTLRKDGGAE